MKVVKLYYGDSHLYFIHYSWVMKYYSLIVSTIIKKTLLSLGVQKNRCRVQVSFPNVEGKQHSKAC